MLHMPKRHYVLALVSYLSIPVVMMAGASLFRVIDPEMARGHADYATNYRLLEMAGRGVLMAAAGLALVLWIATCGLLLHSRGRSLLWLALAAAGPFGFIAIAMLEDRSPAPDDRYQQFIRKLKIYWRVPLEAAVFVAVFFLAYEIVVLMRELMISYQSFSTGTPAATIIAQQGPSGGMWAFGEALETLYLLVLISLLWPLCFNLAGRFFKRPGHPVYLDGRTSPD